MNILDFEVSIMTFPQYQDKKLFILNLNETVNKILVGILFFDYHEEKTNFEIQVEELLITGKSIIAECYFDFEYNTQKIINYHLLCEKGVIRKLDAGPKESLNMLNNYNFSLHTNELKNI